MATEPETTAPVTEPATEPTAATVAPSAQVGDADFYLPLPEFLADAVFAEGYVDDDGYINVRYDNANETAMAEFLHLCSVCGLYSREIDIPDAVSGYALHPLYQDFMAITYLEKDSGQLVVLTDYTEDFLYPEQLDAYLAYYRQEVTFPGSFGKNVAPLFCSSIGQPQAESKNGSGIDHIFHGEKHINEVYSNVSPRDLQKYVDEMILCGFGTWVVMATTNNSDDVESLVLQFTNGDVDVAVAYHLVNQSASVYYPTGGALRLLTVEEYTQYIPQK